MGDYRDIDIAKPARLRRAMDRLVQLKKGNRSPEEIYNTLMKEGHHDARLTWVIAACQFPARDDA